MESVPNLKCTCGNCGEVIEYPPDAVGMIVECPKCKEQSKLPEPPPFNPSEGDAPDAKPPKICPDCGSPMEPYGKVCATCNARKRRTLSLVAGVVSALFVLGVGWMFLKRFYSSPTPRPAQPSHMVLQQPLVKTPKSLKDFKISGFQLETKRGSTLVVAVGDISNISANLYLRLQADVDLLDAKGVKIGTATDHLNELLPGKTWRFIATVNDPRVKSVRFASVKEQQ